MAKTLGPEQYVVLGRMPKFRRPLPPKVTFCRTSEIAQCVRELAARSVVISLESSSTDALMKAMLGAERKRRFEELVTIEPPKASSVPLLRGFFRDIVGAVGAYRWLPFEELLTVIAGKDQANRFIGGVADVENETVALLRGNSQTTVVPFSFFEPSGNGVAPDFTRLSFTDYGHTVVFGEYEASADAILYETDVDYRRKLTKERKRNERSFGASLQRLRLQKRLKRSDFAGISSKTIARIERNEVEKPHGKTLETLAQRLGVPADQIETY